MEKGGVDLMRRTFGRIGNPSICRQMAALEDRADKLRAKQEKAIIEVGERKGLAWLVDQIDSERQSVESLIGVMDEMRFGGG
jgi:hypothetical protein